MMEKAGHDNQLSEQSEHQQQEQQHPPTYNQLAINYRQPRGNQQQDGYVQQGYAAASGRVVVSSQPQPIVVYAATVPPPADCFGWSLLACFCCFFPTGSVAIYYAMEARTAWANGDRENAHRYSEYARNLVITSVVIAKIWIIIVVAVNAYKAGKESNHCTK
ncbi:synapse differentiation-inducing gene protein 1-like isoform X1 [Dreissena polymorpha]|uniref:Uncharacterized protein n=1 Tax=Dreissena polymorpha TaxID=45954 RepID=A0A9D4QJA1_DREPO|nr:synapse differentiation-inducing gene protein 1-like isoform X1 [Dreissena polymorpha]XP_052282907.1 synapse differentiation-inducing gene protein 1-like isoform X1 [Dreissena polymorpha]KAH3833683.1 hypothetical protein DPMN_106996 [Dreissena polymorpha]